MEGFFIAMIEWPHRISHMVQVMKMKADAADPMPAGAETKAEILAESVGLRIRDAELSTEGGAQ